MPAFELYRAPSVGGDHIFAPEAFDFVADPRAGRERDGRGVRARLEGLAHLDQARELFRRSALDPDFVDFLTLPAYDVVLADER